ncbi:MAG TPA: TolC family protein [Gemmatimonadaceae bacterium]|nr:TolC family protein [Gemmatimonadaceae bacterium]
MRAAAQVAAVLLVPAFAPLAAQDADDARPITLETAVEAAQRNLPGAVQARGALRTASAQRRTALGAFMPSLNMNMGTGRTQGAIFFQGNLVPLTGNPWNYSNGVSSNLELFDGGRRLHELRRTGAQVDAADASVVAARYDIALQVKQQYFAVLAARESESAARAQLEQAQAQLQASIARVGAGAATKSDSLRSIIQVGNAQLAVLSAQNDLRVANAALTRLVSSDVQVTAMPSDTAALPDEAALPGQDALERLAMRGPSVEAAQANLVAARMSRRSVRTQYMPTISMSFNYGLNSASQQFRSADLLLFGEEAATRQTYNFNLSFPLFNGFNREQQQVTANVAYDNAQAAARDAQLAARQTLQQQLRALETASARVQVQLATIAAAEEDLRVQQQRYQLGASTVLDLLTSQTQLNTARTALIQARLDARIAKAQLEALIGQDLP